MTVNDTFVRNHWDVRTRRLHAQGTEVAMVDHGIQSTVVTGSKRAAQAAIATHFTACLETARALVEDPSKGDPRGAVVALVDAMRAHAHATLNERTAVYDTLEALADAITARQASEIESQGAYA